MLIKDLCSACNGEINQPVTGEPYLPYKNIILCSSCYGNLIEKIYRKAGMGDGGVIHLTFKYCLTNAHNRRRRKSLAGYKRIFKELLHKYKFNCIDCGEKEEKKLSIDHIMPVSKGGTDDFDNLQILCKSCNSSKGNRVA